MDNSNKLSFLRQVWNGVDALLVYSFIVGLLVLTAADIIRVLIDFIFNW